MAFFKDCMPELGEDGFYHIEKEEQHKWEEQHKCVTNLWFSVSPTLDILILELSSSL